MPQGGELGYDVISVSDHLGMRMPAPFAALMLAAQATERVRLGTCVLDTPFYNPMLLARDIVGVDVFSGGRLEIGLGAGAGFAEDEFVKAGIPFESAGKRVDHLERTLDVLSEFYADPSEPDPMQRPGPKLLLAAGGKRVLRLATQRADIIAVSGIMGAVNEFDAHMDAIRADLGDRADDVELNNVVFLVKITDDRQATLREMDGVRLPVGISLSAQQAAESPNVMIGTPEELAEQIRGHRDRFGFSYFTVMEDGMEDFARAIAVLRGQG